MFVHHKSVIACSIQFFRFKGSFSYSYILTCEGNKAWPRRSHQHTSIGSLRKTTDLSHWILSFYSCDTKVILYFDIFVACRRYRQCVELYNDVLCVCECQTGCTIGYCLKYFFLSSESCYPWLNWLRRFRGFFNFCFWRLLYALGITFRIYEF